MLRLWLSRDRKRNTEAILNEICANADRGTGGQILIVPEQFSHTTERQLCTKGGDQISRFAEVLGFSRLATRVFSQVGGCGETETNRAGRLLMMALAVEQVRSRLKIYGTSVTKPDFLLQLLDTLDEFRSFCVTAERLRQVGRELTGVLAEKAEEFALLMESFDAVSAQMGQNPETRLNRLLTALDLTDFAVDKRFYFDGFSDFNGVEREIIAQLLNKGAEVTVALTCDGLHGTQQQFAAQRETAKALLQETGDQKAEICLLPEEGEASPLTYLRRHLFSGKAEAFPGPQDSVCFLGEKDRVGECRCAVGEILRLNRRGIRWRDISIACGDFAAYRPILETLFRRNEIPAYFAGNTEILRQPVVHMLLTALEAAAGQMEQEDVLAYVKSGFVPLKREDCDRLENYVLLWNIRGSLWEKDWTMHPGGLNIPWGADGEKALEELNQSRRQVISPLLHLRHGLKKAKNTGKMILCLNEFLEDISLMETLNQYAQQMADQGNAQQAQEYVQIYGLICDLMEQVYGVLGQSVRSPEEFFRIFRTALSVCDVGTIPASLDCVTVGSLMSQRRCDTAHVFLLGGEEGTLPSAQMKKSLLTDMERMDLLRLGLNLGPTADRQLDRELAAIDSVFSAPTKKLYLSAPQGKEAYLLRRGRLLFPDAPVLAGDENLIRYGCREYLDYLTANAHGIPQSGEAFASQAKKLAEAVNYHCGDLDRESVKRLYGKELRLSSSKIDTLASCRFSYFLKYGLKAQERKPVQMEANVFGTFVHKVLEETVAGVMEEGGFHQVSLERTLELSQKATEDYIQAELKDLWQSAKAEYLFQRNLSEVRAVVKDLYAELSQSAFQPKWMELHFARDGALPAVKIAGERVTATLEGFVDRADVWRDGDCLYVRIVDYKTGKKSFEFTKVLNGLGLQMLLYLFALEKFGEQIAGQELMPAGALYFPARVARISLADKDKTDTIETKRKQNLKRSGLILNREPVLKAMEPSEKPYYLPFTLDKEGQRQGNLYTTDQLALLESFVVHRVGALADDLFSGATQPNPYEIRNQGGACDFCPYGSVCRQEHQERWLAPVTKPEEFWAAVKEAEKNE